METRDNRFDNLKAILIFLVVLCHFFELFEGNIRYRIYMYIYSFHMPVFVFISGYFAKFNPKAILTKQIYTYVVFQTIYCLLFSDGIAFTTPYWHLWYLYCLIIWCLSIPAIKKYTWLWVSVTMIFSLLSGMIDINGKSFSFYRLFSFYPFFILGFACHKYNIIKKRNFITFISGIVIFVISVYLTSKYIPNMNTSWLLRSDSFKNTGCDAYSYIFIMAISLCWCIAFMVLAADKYIPIITNIGKYSVCVFLLHGFVQRIFLLYCNPFVYSEPVNIIMSFIISFVLCLLFGNKYIFKLIHPLTNSTFITNKFISKTCRKK